jgi:monoamine oxidase
MNITNSPLVVTVKPSNRNITTEFEREKVEAWFIDSSEQGGFVQLPPYQYGDAMNLLMKPIHPMYLAGEAISYSHSWIQGAPESGLTAAYNLYSYDMKH